MYKKYRVIAMQDEHTVLIDYGLTNGARIGGTLYIIKPQYLAAKITDRVMK